MVETKQYCTFHNGGECFKVVIESHEATIYEYDSEYGSYKEDKLTRILIMESFIGEQFGGTVLLRLNDDTYMFIGDSIYTFRSIDPIDKYFSPVGNSDVPYPYAVDINNRCYLMIEYVILDNNRPYGSDPYNLYYSESLITADRGFEPPMQPTIEFENIKKFYIGDDSYTMRYSPEKNEYERLTETGTITIEYSDGVRKELGKNDYYSLMNRFANTKGFRPIEIISVLIY